MIKPKVTPKLRPDGRIERRVLLPKAVAARADELAGSQSIEAFSTLVNRLVDERLKEMSSVNTVG